jgi:hypothetical protein
MGDFEVPVSAGMESSVKYHSFVAYILTSTAKTLRDSIWWVVLVGRYPRGFKPNLNPRSVAPPELSLETNKKGDHNE